VEATDHREGALIPTGERSGSQTYRDDGKGFAVRADEKLAAFLKLETAILAVCMPAGGTPAATDLVLLGAPQPERVNQSPPLLPAQTKNAEQPTGICSGDAPVK
jgi:hypothetical protein